MLSTEQLEREAERLIHHVVEGVNSGYEGTWTLSVYDTAWVSMIKHPRGHWLFPECFQFLLQQQQEDGGWPKYASDIDGIMNTLAALLAIEKRLADSTMPYNSPTKDLQQRKSRGLRAVQDALNVWDVGACLHVGFEVIVPALLSMLAGQGVKVEFPGELTLTGIHKEKMKNFNPEILYGDQQNTLLHSLEAFGQDIDYSRLTNHMVGGSMLGSPSATAAYLIWSPQWDSKAEDYLRRCIKNGGGRGCGGVPCAYPCEIFEISWSTLTHLRVLTTLLRSGLPRQMFLTDAVMSALHRVASLLEEAKGKIGFAKGMLPDADDTAKTMQLLNEMGILTDVDPMISQFLSPKGHMMTYVGERNMSISANCNALSCILGSPHVGRHQSSVAVLTRTLCETWWKGETNDKWNLSQEYISMLLAQTLVLLLQQWDHGNLPLLPASLVRDRVVIVLLQLLNQILPRTLVPLDETAPKSAELVAYDLLACSALRSLPFSSSITQKLEETMAQRKDYLTYTQSHWEDDQYIWIEKVTYGCRILTKSYCVAALFGVSHSTSWSGSTEKLLSPSSLHAMKLSKFFRAIVRPDEELWKYEASVSEGMAFTHRLRSARTLIFPQRVGFEDKYLAYIPIAWTLVNNFQVLGLPASLLWEMMNFSLLDFLVDEYMESTVARLDLTSRKYIKDFICTQLFAGLNQEPASRKRPLTPETDTESANTPQFSARLESVKSVIAKYVKEVTLHPNVVRASQNDRLQVRRELYDFLMAHMVQMEDNEKLKAVPNAAQSSEQTAFLASTPSSFFYWAHTTASQHISCPVSFAFFTCLLSVPHCSKHAMDCFVTPEQKYIASDLCVHLAVMSRLFNDYASTSRDHREGNLNSVNFPEFHAGGTSRERIDMCSARNSLLRLGEYERSASNSAMSRLLLELQSPIEGQSRKRADFICRGIRLFAGVTDLFADMYVAKDLTNAAK